MEIIYRNFIRLMSAGAFSTDCAVEPMSKYKWNQMLALASTYGVADYVSAGIISVAAGGGRLIPKDIAESAYARYDTPAANASHAKKPFDPNKADTAKFASFYLNRKLKRIVNNEIHSIDTSTASLTLLYMIIDNINGIISDWIDFRQIIGLGLYMRSNGDKIDFVKTEGWLRTLGISKPASLVGSFLTALFGFADDEVQFISKSDRNAADKAVKPLKHTLSVASEETDIRDYQDKLAHKTHLSDSRILCRLHYFPVEVASRFFVGIAKSLSNIEE